MRKILILFVILPWTLGAFAQTQDLALMKPSVLKNFGRNADRMNDVQSAVIYYRAYIEKRPKDIKTVYRLAELEEKFRDYKSAEQHYALVHSHRSDDYPKALYDRGRMQKMLGDYASAKKNIESYLSKEKNAIDRELKKEATNEMLGCDTAMMLLEKPLKVLIKNVGTDVNKPHIEFSPMPISETEFLFGSLPEKEVRMFAKEDEKPKRKIYLAERQGDAWVNKGDQEWPFNTEEYHNAHVAFSLDGNRMYFTRCYEDWKNEVICELWVSKNANGKWKEPIKLNDEVNLAGYSSSQPTVGMDSKTGKEIVYFTSNRPEGTGGTDIWYTVYDQQRDRFSAPRNAGREVNTSRDEMAPFYFEKEKKLYFSTNGRSGLGGFDIYSARGEMKKWLPAMNIGAPINSSVDDIHYVLQESGDEGFFVSNRAGGSQMLHETCCDDIYSFEKINPIKIKVEGIALNSDGKDYVNGLTDDMKMPTGATILEDASVDVFLIEKKGEVLLKTIRTDKDGKFSIELEPDLDYRFEIRKDGFLNNNIEISTQGKTSSEVIQKTVGVSKLYEGAIIIENVEFEFNSANLTVEAKKTIDESLLKVLKENPSIKVEIGAHTDNRGTEEYNQRLSQQRAESVMKYLIQKGVESRRMEAKGYGEKFPLAPNENADGTDNEKGRQRNRRTEFKIIGNIPVKVVNAEED